MRFTFYQFSGKHLLKPRTAFVNGHRGQMLLVAGLLSKLPAAKQSTLHRPPVADRPRQTGKLLPVFVTSWLFDL